MENTMIDLRREVAMRLRTALHGREIDTLEVEVELPHMLGITPLGKSHDRQNEDMTLMDSRHEFWDDYDEIINTRRKAEDKIKTAIHSLRRDGTFRMTYPYGKEADIVYIEVDDITEDNPMAMQTSCAECNGSCVASPEIIEYEGGYSLSFNIDCTECSFEKNLGTNLHRQW